MGYNSTLENIHIDFNYKCPKCKSESIDIETNSDIMWGNDLDGELFEKWFCRDCGLKFQCWSRVSVIMREIYFEEVRLV